MKKLTGLTHLDLSGTEVSDEGIGHLKGMTRLNYLNLFETKVTRRGYEDLSASLPDCRIEMADL